MARRQTCIAAWERYDAAIPRTPDPIFESEKIKGGILLLPEQAKEIVFTADRIEFASELTSPGFITATHRPDELAAFRASSHFRIVAGALRVLMRECVSQLEAPVANLLGSPWRILNVRVYTTPPTATVGKQMFGWHIDGMPTAIFKVMIYFTPMDREHGGLEVCEEQPIFVSGPANSWVLFYNSTIKHRAVPGRTQERAAAEITLARSRLFDLALRTPGINAHWPEFP